MSTECRCRLLRGCAAPGSSTETDRTSGYSWTIGPQLRGRGTLQHDYVALEASQLGGDRLLAVYPALDWWEYREATKIERIPYAVVVSVDFGTHDIDVYTAIQVVTATTIAT